MVQVVGTREQGQEGDAQAASFTIGDSTPVLLRIKAQGERHAMSIHNNSSVGMALGGVDVTYATGFLMSAGEKLSMDIGKGDVYAIAESGASNDVRVIEL
jgi:hypothetical protein